MNVTLQVSYDAYSTLSFDLPEGKTWDDVEDLRIKYLRVQIFFNDGTCHEEELDPPQPDTKWPDCTTVYDKDYSKVLGEY